MKRLLIIILLLCIFSVSANIDNLVLDLTRENYGTNQNFEGNILINGSESFYVNEEIIAEIKNCDSENVELSFTLYEILTNAGLFSGPMENYFADSPLNTINSGNNIFGFEVENQVSELSFILSGTGNGLFIDIGNDDEKDWQYLGAMNGWSSYLYPEGFEGVDMSSVGFDEKDAESGGICNEFSVTFNEFIDEMDIKISAVAQRESEGNELRASIDNYRSCTLNSSNWDQIGEWVDISCNITEDLSGYSGNNKTFNICIEPISGNNFIVPRYHTNDGNYYFIKLQKGMYNEQLSNNVLVESELLKDSINDYISSNCNYNDDCLIPFKLILNSGSATLSSLDIKYGSITGHNFYNVSFETSEVNLEDEEISLSNFEDLKTPSAAEENCTLEISFNGKSDEEDFSISDSSYATIFVSSNYFAKGFEVLFNLGSFWLSENATITDYAWEFGDGENSSLSSPKHIYNSIGDYTVTLTVEDSEGFVSSDSIEIEIVDLEEYLDLKLPESLDELNSSYAESLTGKYLKIYNLFDFNLSSINFDLENLKINFTEIREGNLSNYSKEEVYHSIIVELNTILKKIPKLINIKSSSFVGNLKINMLNDIIPYVGKMNLEDSYKKALYTFNQEKVNVDAEFSLFDIEFLEGKRTYLFVEKDIIVSGGSNNVIVEDLRDYSFDEIYSDASMDESNKVIYWDISGSKVINYILEAEELGIINTIIFSNVDFDSGEVIYEFYCANPPCDYRYCGDGLCTLGYENKENCPKDCGGKLPIFWFVILGVILILGVIYFNLYKGPGNFQNLANKITYNLFKRKLFVSERDKVTLGNYINQALRRGFSKEQIYSVLIRKGWNKKQIKEIFK